MTRFPSTLLAVLVMFKIVGCSSDDEPPPPIPRWQAIHANADGDGWRGPIRKSNVIASEDADRYADLNGFNRDEMMVLAIYPGMNTDVNLPPNPMAERPLSQPVTLDALIGYWEMTYPSTGANQERNFLDIRSGGKCKTDFGARFTDQPFTGFDEVEVLGKSSFVLAITAGESYVFSVTRFEGDEMEALIDGIKEQAVQLTRIEHPSGLKVSSP